MTSGGMDWNGARNEKKISFPLPMPGKVEILRS